MERKAVPGWDGVEVTKTGLVYMVSSGRAVPIAPRAKGTITVVFHTPAGPIAKSANIQTLIGLAWGAPESKLTRPGESIDKKKTKRAIDPSVSEEEK